MKPTKRDYDELTEAFARVLYVFRFPDALADGVETHKTRMALYFQSDPVAHHALNSLVSIAIHAPETWGMTDEQRADASALREAEVQRLLSMGAMVGESPLMKPKE